MGFPPYYELAKLRIAELHREAELRRLAASASRSANRGRFARVAGALRSAVRRATLRAPVGRESTVTPAPVDVSRRPCAP